MHFRRFAPEVETRRWSSRLRLRIVFNNYINADNEADLRKPFEVLPQSAVDDPVFRLTVHSVTQFVIAVDTAET
jgi:hypothetical protein